MHRLKFVIPALLICLSACSSFDSESRRKLAKAQTELNSNPQNTLAICKSLLEKHPKNIETLLLQAQSLEKLDQKSAAALQFYNISKSRAAKSDQQMQLALHGCIRNYLAIFGDLPHRVEIPPAGEYREQIVQVQWACNQILEDSPGDHAVEFAKAVCLYRSRLFDRAMPIVKKLQSEAPKLEFANYLFELIKEQQSSLDAESLQVYGKLMRSSNRDLQKQVARHLLLVQKDPQVSSELRMNAKAYLVRFVRSNTGSNTNELGNWIEEQNSLQAAILQEDLAHRLMQEASQERERQNWQLGWNLLLSQGVKSTEQWESYRKEYAQAWAAQLLNIAEIDRKKENFVALELHIQNAAALPKGFLSPNQLGRLQSLNKSYNSHAAKLAAGESLALAKRYLEMQSPNDVLKSLEQIDQSLSPFLGREVDLLRAQALALRGDNKEALALLDQYAPYEDAHLLKLYGILLSKQNRADEAETILERLPFGHLSGEAFEALLISFEQQRRWEEVLSRSLVLQPFPKKLRPIRARACLQSAQKFLRIDDSQGALDLFNTYLDEDELSTSPIASHYIEALIGAGKTQKAQSTLSKISKQEFISLPLKTIDHIRNQLIPSLADKKQFLLLEKIYSQRSDLPADSKYWSLWPRFGRYLPESGSYLISYRNQKVDLKGNQSPEKAASVALSWNGKSFTCKTDDEIQNWKLEDGIFFLDTGSGTHQIPTQTTTKPPYPRIRYSFKGEDWIAEIMESGTSIAIDGELYSACQSIRLSSTKKDGDSILLTLAPKLGVIREEHYSAGKLSWIKELIKIEKLFN